MTHDEEERAIKGERPYAFDHDWHSLHKSLDLHYRIWRHEDLLRLYLICEPYRGWKSGGLDALEEPSAHHILVAEWPADMPFNDRCVPAIIEQWFFWPKGPVPLDEVRELAFEEVWKEAQDDDWQWNKERARRLAEALEHPEHFTATS